MIDYDLLNELIKACIGIPVGFVILVLTYLLKNVLVGYWFLNNEETKNRENEIKRRVHEELNKKGK